MSNEKTRIFCIITQGELGGAQQFVAQLAHNLDQEYFSLHVVWGATSQSTLAQLLPQHTTFATARHLVRGWSPWHDIMSIFELRRQILDYRPDVVLCISSKAGFVGALAAHTVRSRIPKMKVVYRIGGWAFNDPRPLWEKYFYIALERLSARWKDYIVLNNTHDLNQAKKLRIKPRSKALRIYNGIDPYLDFLPRVEAKIALEERIPERYRATPHEHLVGTIANMYPAKDLITLVRAASQVSKNTRFIVIGDGPLKNDLIKKVREHGLENRFFLLGNIKHAYKYLSALDVFVLPSLKEGLPWALLEAMAAKAPIVATRVGAVPEMIENTKSGLLIDPGNANQMAQAITQLLENDRLRQDLAIAAHQNLITHFSLREMIAQYENLFTANQLPPTPYIHRK